MIHNNVRATKLIKEASFVDRQPLVENPQFQELDNQYTKSSTNNRYKIRGTQRYLGIRDRQVMACILADSDGDTCDTDASK